MSKLMVKKPLLSAVPTAKYESCEVIGAFQSFRGKVPKSQLEALNACVVHSLPWCERPLPFSFLVPL